MESSLIGKQQLDEETTKKTLIALNDMRIKFPGKTDEEADYLLDKVKNIVISMTCNSVSLSKKAFT